MVYLFLADGFEEIEALATVDILRRADIDVTTVGIGTAAPCGSHGICVNADITEDQTRTDEMEAVILPGGMPGTLHLAASETIHRLVMYAAQHDLPIGAICAAPSVLGEWGLLDGKSAICYPGFENKLRGAAIADTPVVTDGRITTAKGAGVAVDFALELVSKLKSRTIADEIRGSIQCR